MNDLECKELFIALIEDCLRDLQELIECKKFISTILPPYMRDEKVQLLLEVGVLELRAQSFSYQIIKIKESL